MCSFISFISISCFGFLHRIVLLTYCSLELIFHFSFCSDLAAARIPSTSFSYSLFKSSSFFDSSFSSFDLSTLFLRFPPSFATFVVTSGPGVFSTALSSCVAAFSTSSYTWSLCCSPFSGVARSPQVPRPRGARRVEGARQGPPGRSSRRNPMARGPNKLLAGGPKIFATPLSPLWKRGSLGGGVDGTCSLGANDLRWFILLCSAVELKVCVMIYHYSHTGWTVVVCLFYLFVPCLVVKQNKNASG